MEVRLFVSRDDNRIAETVKGFEIIEEISKSVTTDRLNTNLTMTQVNYPAVPDGILEKKMKFERDLAAFLQFPIPVHLPDQLSQ